MAEVSVQGDIQDGPEIVEEPALDFDLTEEEHGLEILPPNRVPQLPKPKQTRERLHPIWDAPNGLGLSRKNILLIQCNATDPWKEGTMQKTWKDIASAIQAHAAFEGVKVPSWKTLQEAVKEWLTNFGASDNKNKGKTGTDDEEYSEYVKLMTELKELKGSTEALAADAKQDTEEEARKKKANIAAACALMDASAKGLQKRVAAKKKGRKEFAKLNDSEEQMLSSDDDEDTRKKKPRVSGGIASSIELFVHERAAARLAKQEVKDAERKAKEARRSAKDAERKERWELEKAERLLRLEIERKKLEKDS
ncbi:hypothetical protein CYMTET_49069 [Cymbomonas tetramitiformis]|uniref:No apical meristem-associated C-terminal domain-containing protein n=1 Tax=Cymbomonas tetramitiformis TaxID=36881 RepID=A0AAE0BQV2_9CHLO|nr:hypothetical protein CYMTET_49069 [Cymbomonas tetramitiformis]